MNFIKTILIIGFTIFISNFSSFGQTTEFTQILDAFKKADSKQIYSLCDNSINLSIQSTYGKYSKTQTRRILDEFFKKHDATHVKEIKTQTEQPQDNYTILDYKSGNQGYTIFIQLSKVGSKFLIQKIQIQETQK